MVPSIPSNPILCSFDMRAIWAHFPHSSLHMFLFSGRAYWQELIESILWSHHKLKIIPHIQPTALSISQGRAVGLIHYTLGGIGCTWAFIISRILVLTSWLIFTERSEHLRVSGQGPGLLFGLSDWISSCKSPVRWVFCTFSPKSGRTRFWGERAKNSSHRWFTTRNPVLK